MLVGNGRRDHADHDDLVAPYDEPLDMERARERGFALARGGTADRHAGPGLRRIFSPGCAAGEKEADGGGESRRYVCVHGFLRRALSEPRRGRRSPSNSYSAYELTVPPAGRVVKG